ncbi:M14 family zinc carboxypeptidase [Eionea flava]
MCPSIKRVLLSLIILSINTQAAFADDKTIFQLCEDIGNKLGSVNSKDCIQQQLTSDGSKSTFGYPLAYKEYLPVEGKRPLGKVLLMGGIHGDEYSAISIMFRWMEKLNQHHSGLFHWLVIPNLNPDGLLQKKSQRQNANGVDLNRNFPSKNWDALALKYWKERTYKNPRRYPGPYALSELETQWFSNKIESFAPSVIIAVHAPHRLVDFDGAINAPKRLGNLQLRLLGTYPGSLGNYAGVDLNIPVVTVELASAGIMPSDQEITRMWVDIVRWLKREVPKLN